MSHGTYAWLMKHMDESWHIRMSHGTCEGVTAHTKESWHVWMSHDECKWVMAHMHNKCWGQTIMILSPRHSLHVCMCEKCVMRRRHKYLMRRQQRPFLKRNIEVQIFFEEIWLLREKIEGSVKRCQNSLHVCVCQKWVMRRQERKDLEVEDTFEKIGLCEEKIALF